MDLCVIAIKALLIRSLLTDKLLLLKKRMLIYYSYKVMYGSKKRIFRRNGSGNGTIICQNCGSKGHHHRDCKEPKSSLGVIAYTKDNNNTIKYLMICRRNTIGFVQFLRGQYVNSDIEYIQKLFNVMTTQEIEYITNKDFDFLWEYLWLDNFYSKSNDKIRKDKDIAQSKFEKTKNGYNTGGNVNIDIKYFIDNKSDFYKDPEWGFPKGRRNFNETNFQTARREFCEETGIKDNDIFLSTSCPYFDEEYKSYDNITYRNTYYLAEFLGNLDEIKITPENKEQYTEVSDIQFFKIDKALEYIRDYSSEKKNILIQIDTYLKNKLSMTTSKNDYELIMNNNLSNAEWDGYPKSI